MSCAKPAAHGVDAQSLRAAFHAVIRRFGLLDVAQTPCGQPLAVSHAHALMELLRSPAASQGELARALGLSKSAVSRMAVRLARRGWIERRKDVDDARVRRLTLTARGRDLAQRVEAASLARFSATLDGIAPAQRAQTISMLAVLHRAIPTGRP